VFLETPVRLFRFLEKYNPSWNPYIRDGYTRQVDQNFASGFGAQFSDGFPFLVINESSLADLNDRIGRELPSNRFRPNIIILGKDCWEEDNWREIRIFDPSDEDYEECRLNFVKPCKRCKVTTVDQSTAYLDFEPLFTLTEFRNGVTTGFSKDLPNCSHSAFFGWNAVSTKNGRVSVGDTVEVLKEGPWSSSKTTSSMFDYFRHQLFKLTN